MSTPESNMSDYDRKIHAAIMRLGSPRPTATEIADEMGRPRRGMAASLKAATGRVEWLECTDGLWGFTALELQRIGQEQLAEELDAEDQVTV
jgi:hypothetical protein